MDGDRADISCHYQPSQRGIDVEGMMSANMGTNRAAESPRTGRHPVGTGQRHVYLGTGGKLDVNGAVFTSTWKLSPVVKIQAAEEP